MKTRPLQTSFLAIFLLCLAAPHMPAPITVPQEDAPQTKVVPPEDAPKKKKEAAKPVAAKPAPPKVQKHAPGSMDGTWVGEIHDEDPRTVALKTVKIAKDEQTVVFSGKFIRTSLELRGLLKSEPTLYTAQCERTGNTILYHTTDTTHATLRLQADGTIAYTDWMVDTISGKQTKPTYAGILKRQN